MDGVPPGSPSQAAGPDARENLVALVLLVVAAITLLAGLLSVALS